MDKICTICGIDKSEESFYAEKRNSSGRRSDCKDCFKLKRNKYYHENSDEIKGKLRTDRNKDGGIAHAEYLREWRSNNPDKQAAIAKRARDKFPEKTVARERLKYAIKTGAVTRKPCEVCGSVKVEGHHWSYLKENWLNVNWLCRKHHAEEHLDLR